MSRTASSSKGRPSREPGVPCSWNTGRPPGSPHWATPRVRPSPAGTGVRRWVMSMTVGGSARQLSSGRREVQRRVGGVFDVGPAGGDDFGAGVEGDPFGAVDVFVAEQGVLPAAE